MLVPGPGDLVSAREDVAPGGTGEESQMGTGYDPSMQ